MQKSREITASNSSNEANNQLDLDKDAILDQFGKQCRIDLNLADATVEKHLRYIGRFLEWFDEHPAYATPKDLREFLSQYEDRPGTRQGTTKSLRVFFREFMDMDIAEGFKVPRLSGKKTTIPPEREELVEFYNALEKDRDRAIFLLYASSGMRKNEALDLKVKNVDFGKRMIVPPENGSSTKRRYITFYNEEAEKKLNSYLKDRELNPEDELFPFSEGVVTYFFRKAKKETGIRISPQRLREWFCNEMGKLGVSDRYIDAFCGRVPKSVLANHYTDFSPEKLKEVYDEARIKVLE